MSAIEYRKFICRACGLVYDEAVGDEDGGLAAGTRFEDIPDDWACPLCGVGKADFEPYDDTEVIRRSAPSAPGRRAARTGRHAAGVLIIGGGTAAWAVAERVRELDAERPITLVSACSADRYEKPRLSVAFAQGVVPQGLCRESGQDAAQRLGVRLLAHTTAVGLNPKARRLRTTRGTLAFDHLVLAHGAEARRCPGLPDELTWRINDLSSYRRMREALARLGAPQRPATVLIVGAGLVGCELANDLALAGHPVTLLDAAERPLPMASSGQSAALLQAWSSLPLRFLGGVSVSDAQRRGAGGVVLNLRDGRHLEADVLISATGLQTPSRLALQAGLRCEDGIVVDPETLATGLPHVHALGDCVSIGGRPQRYIEPILRQSRIVAARICGTPSPVYAAAAPVVRVKTSSLPLTLRA